MINTPTKPRVFSGIQPTGSLHLGNYLGAIRDWTRMQDEYDCIYGIMDLHAITLPKNPEELRNSIREVAAALIAAGIDTQRCILFPQSTVSAHAELAWILNCHTPLGWLNRMTQFKEKAGISSNIEHEIQELKTLKRTSKKAVSHQIWTEKSAENFIDSQIKRLENITKNSSKASLGLYAYPVLQAADILIYHATHVPVGEDQKQHLELSRDIAGAFNRAYQEGFFALPEPLIRKEAARIMSLKDGSKKMSKSDPSALSRIDLTDDADTIAKKFKKAKSDMIEGIYYDAENRPEASNLLTIYAALSDTSREKVEAEFANSSFSAFKAALTDLAVETLTPITSKMRVLLDDPENIDRLLQDGTERAQEIAAKNLAEIKELIGLPKAVKQW